ncbi:unnamed protein product [Ectocarpus sp. 6 AP-2014]
MATESSNSAVAATLADPQYKAGRKLIDDGRLEEAVNFFSGLLETRVQVLSGDEMSPSLAPLYYEYGNSLLYNAEESGAVFGDAITDAEQKKRAMAIVEAQINGQAAAAAAAAAAGGGAAGEGATGGAEGEGAAAQAPSPDQEAEEDLELAWENLEMARRIYGGLELTEDIRTAIAKVHLRLGDLNMVNGMYNEAADEFEKCLDHRLALPCRQSRGVADAHVRRAQALFYASTLEGAEKDALVGQSLEQYRLAMGVFDAMLASLKEAPEVTAAAADPSADAASPGKENSDAPNTSNGSGSSNGKGKGKGKGGAQGAASPPPSAASAIEELEDVRDAIRETIDTMVSGKDMEALAEYKSGTGTTTVGFGNPSPASAFSGGGGGGGGGGSSSNGGVAATPAAGEVTTVGFGAQQSGATTTAGFGGASAAAFAPAGAGGGAAANVMVVKRKGRPAPKPATAATAPMTAPVAGVGAEAVVSPKKAKPSKE